MTGGVSPALQRLRRASAAGRRQTMLAERTAPPRPCPHSPAQVHLDYTFDRLLVGKLAHAYALLVPARTRPVARLVLRTPFPAAVAVSDCGRDAGCPAPPAQIRTCPLRHPAPPLGCAHQRADGESLDESPYPVGRL